MVENFWNIFCGIVLTNKYFSDQHFTVSLDFTVAIIFGPTMEGSYSKNFEVYHDLFSTQKRVSRRNMSIFFNPYMEIWTSKKMKELRSVQVIAIWWRHAWKNSV